MTEQYQFNPEKDWVSMRTEKWTELVKDLIGKPVRMCEIGCFEGRSTIWWLDNLLTHEESRILCIDPQMNPETLSRFMGNLHRHPDFRKVSWIRGLSQRSLPGQANDSFDFSYIDGSHEGWDVLLDACLVFRKTKIGGIMLFDDYEWTGHPHYNNRVHPGKGIDAFIETHEPMIEVIFKEYQVAVRKTANAD